MPLCQAVGHLAFYLFFFVNTPTIAMIAPKRTPPTAQMNQLRSGVMPTGPKVTKKYTAVTISQ